MSKLHLFTLPLASSILLAGLAGCNSDSSETDETDTVETEDCNDNEDNDGDGDEDCDDADCTSDDACAKDYFNPEAFVMSADFAYNKEANEIRQIGYPDGSTLPPMITLTLALEDYLTGADESAKCDIFVGYTGTTPITPTLWVFTETYQNGTASATTQTVHYGFTLPSEGTEVLGTSCTAEEGFELDPEWGTVEDVVSWTWGAGIGNFRPDVDNAIKSSEGYENLVGGGMFWSAAADPNDVNAPGYLSVGYAVGFQVDADGVVVADSQGNGQFLDPADIVTDDGVPPTGYYRVFSAYGFDAGYLIPQ